jgi:hypothetical protein
LVEFDAERAGRSVGALILSTALISSDLAFALGAHPARSDAGIRMERKKYSLGTSISFRFMLYTSQSISMFQLQ